MTIENFPDRVLSEIASTICMKIKNYFFYEDIRQEIILFFVEGGADKLDKKVAFKIGWQAVEKFRKRDEVNYTTLTKNYEDEPNIDEEITKLSNFGKIVKRDRRDVFYRENIIKKIWKLRADGLTFKEIGNELNINCDTAEHYFKNSIYDQSIETDIKYKALKRKRRRSVGKEKAISILNELKSTNIPMAEIARRNKVQTSTVSKINKGIAWGFLADSYPIRN